VQRKQAPSADIAHALMPPNTYSNVNRNINLINDVRISTQALRTVTYCTENEWTPYRASIGGLILKADATVTESAKK
jgi:hypothetical protein